MENSGSCGLSSASPEAFVSSGNVSSTTTASRCGDPGPRWLILIKRCTSGGKAEKFILLTRCSSRNCNEITCPRYTGGERKKERKKKKRNYFLARCVRRASGSCCGLCAAWIVSYLILLTHDCTYLPRFYFYCTFIRFSERMVCHGLPWFGRRTRCSRAFCSKEEFH